MYSAEQFEEALAFLWSRVESRLTDEDYMELKRNDILFELYEFGPNGPVGLGLGRMGGHAIG